MSFHAQAAEPGATSIHALADRPRLSGEEEHRLEQLTATDPAARHSLIEGNIRLAFFFARRAAGGDPALFLDLLSAANLGLVKAANAYNPSFGVPFGTWAARWIKGEVYAEMKQLLFPATVGGGTILFMSKMRKAAAEFDRHEGRAPTDAELAQVLQCTVRRIQAVRDAAAVVRLDAPVNDEVGAPSVHEKIAAGDTGPDVGILTEAAGIKDVMAQVLSEREQRIITMRFGLDGQSPMELSQVGNAIRPRRTAERIRQIETKAIKKLRQYLRRTGLTHNLPVYRQSRAA